MRKLHRLGMLTVILCTIAASNIPTVPARAVENEARFVKDINPAVDPTGSSAPNKFIRAGAYTYFRANDAFNGRTLWRTDGTAAGTVAVVNKYLIGPGNDFRDNTLLAALDETPYLVTNDGVFKINGIDDVETLKTFDPDVDLPEEGTITRSGNLLYWRLNNGELWRTNGTPDGTFAIKTLANVGNYADRNGTLFFTDQQKLWKTDGTASGTVVVKNIAAAGLTRIGNLVFFYVDAGSSIYHLWRSDGTDVGTFRLFGERTRHLVDVDGVAYFFSDVSLWKTDGTTTGTREVANDPAFHLAHAPVAFNGNLYFSTRDALWRSNGTTSGTIPVTTTATLPDGADIYSLFAASERLYFVILGNSNSNFDKELWTSDGTNAGTRRVAAVRDFVDEDDFFEMDDIVLYADSTVQNGIELWRTDGTATGTSILKDIYVDPTDSDPSEIEPIGDQVVFTANSDVGTELWRSDGTTTGTVLLKDIVPGPDGSWPRVLTNIGDVVVFVVYENDVLNLWRTDGTASGTTRVFRFPENEYDISTSNSGVYDGKFYTLSRDLGNVTRLWTSDGTTAGTFVVKDFGPSSAPDPYPDFTMSGGYLYFRHQDGVNGAQLWRTDGTEDGTTQITRFMSDDESTSLGHLVDLQGMLCFSAEHLDFNALWCSNGTTGGTRVVRNIVPEGREYEISDIVAANNTLFFGTYDYADEADSALWRSNGTTEGTTIVKQDVAINRLHAVRGGVIFHDNSSRLWVSDGTEAGTTRVQVASSFLGVMSDSIKQLQTLGIVMFAGIDAYGDIELWQTDGTVEGTVRSADVFPGPGASNPLPMAAVGNTIFFSANDPEHGRELWTVDIDAPAQNTRVYLPMIAR